ncbi:hypothetical protein [Fretibacterium fastidiosum]|nr:hypothetical protein [Fretibacterium fastidiosum]
MDKVHAYIDEERESYNNMSRRELLEHIAAVSGTFWIEDGWEPWERMNDWPELELLSAFDFLRPELSEEERGILDGWIEKYAGWREQGIFFQRYRETKGSRFTWKKYRERMEEEFGRLIPRSHWWFWPDDKRGES